MKEMAKTAFLRIVNHFVEMECFSPRSFSFVIIATDPHDRGMQFCGSVAARKRKKRSASLAAGTRFRCAASIKAGCAH
jgi:hypothetical protein